MKIRPFIYIIIVALIILSTFFGLVFTISPKSSEDGALVEKTEQEIRFLEDKIIAMMNKLNHINFLNSVLIEEKTTSQNGAEESKKNSKTNSQTEQNSSSNSVDGENSQNSSNSQSNSDSGSNENTRYEIKNARNTKQ